MSQSQKALRHGIKGSAEQLRQTAIKDRHPAGVKEPAFPISQGAIREAIAAQLCPWCGRGPFAMLPVHTNKTHGVDKWELRELAGYSTRDPISSEEARQKMSDAYDPDRGTWARAAAASKQRKPKRWTTAGIDKNRDNLVAWVQANPEQAARQRRLAATAARNEDAQRKRSESLRARHAIRPPSAEQASAFAERMRSPEVVAKRRAVLAAKRQGCGSAASYKRGCRCDACRAAKAESRRTR